MSGGRKWTAPEDALVRALSGPPRERFGRGAATLLRGRTPEAAAKRAQRLARAERGGELAKSCPGSRDKTTGADVRARLRAAARAGCGVLLTPDEVRVLLRDVPPLLDLSAPVDNRDGGAAR